MKNPGLCFMLLAGAMLLLASCTVEKRLYRPGYHVEWKKSTSKTQQGDGMAEKKTAKSVEVNDDRQLADWSESELPAEELSGGDIMADVSTSDELMISALKRVESVLSPKSERKKQNHNESIADVQPNCETLVMIDGRELQVKLLEIGQEELKYKRCDYPDGPTVVVDRTDVDRVIYDNGAVDIISGYSAPRDGGNVQSGRDNRTTSQRLEVMGLLSMIFGIVGLFFFGVLFGLAAVIMGFISMAKFSSRPKEFMGRGFMIAGLIIGFVAVVGALLVISAGV